MKIVKSKVMSQNARSLIVRRLLFIALCLCASVANLQAQATEFTYQGRLLDSSLPPTGNYDFEFSLWNSLVAGTQLGSTNVRSGVVVTNGIFTVRLDFGDQFPDASRFLQIAARPANNGAFTTLAPRQPITSVPYAMRSLSANRAETADIAETANTAFDSAALGGIFANQYVLTGDPRLSDSRNPLPGSANYIQNGTTPQVSSNFNITGNGTVGGNLAVGNGTAANPSLTFGSDTSTGIFRSNAGTLNLATNGASRVQIDASGNTSFSGNVTIPVTTRYVNVNAGGFVPAESNMEYSGSFTRSGTIPGQGVAFTAPLLLPQGATITELQGVIVDNDATRDISIVLYRVNLLSSPPFSVLANFNSSGVTPSTNVQSITTSTISNPVIDNQNNSYLLAVGWTVPTPTGNIAFISIRVTYTVTSPLP